MRVVFCLVHVLQIATNVQLFDTTCPTTGDSAAATTAAAILSASSVIFVFFICQIFAERLCGTAGCRYVGVGVVNVYSGSTEVDGRAVPVPMVAYVVFISRKRIEANANESRRVSLIDYRGQILLDTFVQPT